MGTEVAGPRSAHGATHAHQAVSPRAGPWDRERLQTSSLVASQAAPIGGAGPGAGQVLLGSDPLLPQGERVELVSGSRASSGSMYVSPCPRHPGAPSPMEEAGARQQSPSPPCGDAVSEGLGACGGRAVSGGRPQGDSSRKGSSPG